MWKPTKKEVNEILKGSWTEKGVRDWWDRDRYQLDGRTPAQAWAEGDKELVYNLAWSGVWGGGS